MAAKFEVFEDAIGEFRWRLRAPNGEIVASSQGFRDRRDARRGARALRVAALTARTVEVGE
jgi:uncharacterized protein